MTKKCWKCPDCQTEMKKQGSQYWCEWCDEYYSKELVERRNEYQYN